MVLTKCVISVLPFIAIFIINICSTIIADVTISASIEIIAVVIVAVVVVVDVVLAVVALIM